MNSAKVVTWLTRVKPSTLEALRHLDGAVCGFERPGFADTLTRVKGSYKPAKCQLFVPTLVPPPQWDARAANLGLESCIQKYAEQYGVQSKAAAFFAPEAASLGVIAVLPADGKKGLNIVEHPRLSAVVSPEFDVAPIDRSDCRYVFVCAHAQRDSRCGYCGPVILDLLRTAADEFESAGAVKIYGCSHVGGHAFAGNVCCFSKHGAFSFGCVTPTDVEGLLKFAALHTSSEVPINLVPFFRGYAVSRD
jgi:hypothetical protein